MPTYIDFPLTTDPEDLMQDAFDYLQANVPGWIPSDGQVDVWLIQSLSSAAAELRDVASAVPISIFRYFGVLANVPPLDAATATATSTWTVRDNSGYTIPDGTQVSILDGSGIAHIFETVGDVIIPPGSVATAAGAVSLVAQEPGAASSGIGGAGTAIQLVDVLDFVTGVTLVAATSGGADAELDDDYLNRLSTEMTLLAPRPILPNDFAIFARQITGVYRAIAIDGYNPVGGTSNNPRMVFIALMDINGAAVSAPIKAAVAADLQARRELNFVVNVGDPTRTEIDVTYTAKALPGYDPVDLKTRIDAAIASYLNPATWGTPPTGDPHDWYLVSSVRYLKMAQIIEDVTGVDYAVSLTQGVHGGALAASDVALTGVAPVPHLFGTPTGTIT